MSSTSPASASASASASFSASLSALLSVLSLFESLSLSLSQPQPQSQPRRGISRTAASHATLPQPGSTWLHVSKWALDPVPVPVAQQSALTKPGRQAGGDGQTGQTAQGASEAQLQGSFNAKTIRKVQLSQAAAGAVAGGKDFID